MANITTSSSDSDKLVFTAKDGASMTLSLSQILKSRNLKTGISIEVPRKDEIKELLTVHLGRKPTGSEITECKFRMARYLQENWDAETTMQSHGMRPLKAKYGVRADGRKYGIVTYEEPVPEPKTAKAQAERARTKKAVETVAASYGMTSAELDKMMKAWKQANPTVEAEAKAADEAVEVEAETE